MGCFYGRAIIFSCKVLHFCPCHFCWLGAEGPVEAPGPWQRRQLKMAKAWVPGRKCRRSSSCPSQSEQNLAPWEISCPWVEPLTCGASSPQGRCGYLPLLSLSALSSDHDLSHVLCERCAISSPAITTWMPRPILPKLVENALTMPPHDLHVPTLTPRFWRKQADHVSLPTPLQRGDREGSRVRYESEAEQHCPRSFSNNRMRLVLHSAYFSEKSEIPGS